MCLQTNAPAIFRRGGGPLLTPKDVKPSRPDFKVDGIFNCGAVRVRGETILLCRVAESVRTESEGIVGIPLAAGEAEGFRIVRLVKAEHPELDFSDTRNVRYQSGSTAYLTSLSHLRVARSADGEHFTVDDHPAILPQAEYESWGMEDPRITELDGVYYINYTAVSENGAATALLSTTDFTRFKRHGLIFLPENKDVAIFPEKIGNQYLAFSRPTPGGIGSPGMWLSTSDDLLHWGGHRHFYSGVADDWEGGKVGGGAPPIKTERGFVKIYHAVSRENRYCLGAMLLDATDPSKILAKSPRPLLQPDEPYEQQGFFGNVVFSCGCILEGGIFQIYYGAADDKICRADITADALFTHLGLD
jgi:predicted GH43/DUF377 family glycosyl hydrolase